MTVSGNYAYLVGYFVSVYDVSNPTNAHKIASVQLPDGAAFANTVTVCRNYAYVGPYGGINIYSLGTPAAPQLKMSRTYSNNSLFSWPAPNAAFALQQNSDLNTTNWVALALNPVTVGSENQVAVPRPPGNMFYRLSSQ